MGAAHSVEVWLCLRFALALSSVKVALFDRANCAYGALFTYNSPFSLNFCPIAVNVEYIYTPFSLPQMPCCAMFEVSAIYDRNLLKYVA
jgi:hypothetical protein